MAAMEVSAWNSTKRPMASIIVWWTAKMGNVPCDNVLTTIFSFVDNALHAKTNK